MSSNNLGDIFGMGNVPKPKREISDLVSEFNYNYANQAIDEKGRPAKELIAGQAGSEGFTSSGIPRLSTKGDEPDMGFNKPGLNYKKFDGTQADTAGLVPGKTYALWQRGNQTPSFGIWDDQRKVFVNPLAQGKRPPTPREIEIAQSSDDARIKLEQGGIDFSYDTNSVYDTNSIEAIVPADNAAAVGGREFLRNAPKSAVALAGFAGGSAAASRIPVIGKNPITKGIGGVIGTALASAGAEGFSTATDIADYFGLGVDAQESLNQLANPEAVTAGGLAAQLPFSGPVNFGKRAWGAPSTAGLENRIMMGSEEWAEGVGQRAVEKLFGGEEDVFGASAMAQDAGFGAVMPNMYATGRLAFGAGDVIGNIGRRPTVAAPAPAEGVELAQGSSLNLDTPVSGLFGGGNVGGWDTPVTSTLPMPSGDMSRANWSIQDVAGDLNPENQEGMPAPVATPPPPRFAQARPGAAPLPELQQREENAFRNTNLVPEVSPTPAYASQLTPSDNARRRLARNTNAFVADADPSVAMTVESALPDEATTQTLPFNAQLGAHANLMGEVGGNRGIIPMTIEIGQQLGLAVSSIDNEAVGHWRNETTGEMERNPATQFVIDLEDPSGAFFKGGLPGDIRANLDALAAAIAAPLGQKAAAWVAIVDGNKDPMEWNAGVQLVIPDVSQHGGYNAKLDPYQVSAINEEITRLISRIYGIEKNVDIGVINFNGGLRFIDFSADFGPNGPTRIVHKNKKGEDVVLSADKLARVVTQAFNRTVGRQTGLRATVEMFNFDSNYFEEAPFEVAKENKGRLMDPKDRLTPDPDEATKTAYGAEYRSKMGPLSEGQIARVDAATAEANATRRALAGNADPGFPGLTYDARGIPYNADGSPTNATPLRTDPSGRIAGPARPLLRREVNVPPVAQLGDNSGPGITGRAETSDPLPLPPRTTMEQDRQTRTPIESDRTGVPQPSLAAKAMERNARLGIRGVQEQSVSMADTNQDDVNALDKIQTARAGTKENNPKIKTGRSSELSGFGDKNVVTSSSARVILANAEKTLRDRGIPESLQINVDTGAVRETAPDGASNLRNGLDRDEIRITVLNSMGQVIAVSNSTMGFVGTTGKLSGDRLDVEHGYRGLGLSVVMKAESIRRISDALINSGYQNSTFVLGMSDVSQGNASTKANLRAAEPGIEKISATRGEDSINDEVTERLSVSEMRDLLEQANELRAKAEAVEKELSVDLKVARENYLKKIGLSPETKLEDLTQQQKSELFQAEAEVENEAEFRLESIKEELNVLTFNNMRMSLKVGANYSMAEFENMTEEQLVAKFEQLKANLDRLEGLRDSGMRFNAMGGEKAVGQFKEAIQAVTEVLARKNNVDLVQHERDVKAQQEKDAAAEDPGFTRTNSQAVGPASSKIAFPPMRTRAEAIQDFDDATKLLPASQQEVVKLIASGTNLRTVLQKIADTDKGVNGLMAKLLLKSGLAKSLDKPIFADFTGAMGAVSGFYQPGSPFGDSSTSRGAETQNVRSLQSSRGSIVMDMNKLVDPDEGAAIKTVIHEIVHGLVSESVNRAITGRADAANTRSDALQIKGAGYLVRLKAYIKSPDADPAISSLAQAYLRYYNTLPSRVRAVYEAGDGGAGGKSMLLQMGVQYGAVDLQEFIAEAMSNPSFQAELSKISIGPTNVMSRFKQAVLKILKLTVNTQNESVLTQVMESTAELSSKKLSEIKRFQDLKSVENTYVEEMTDAVVAGIPQDRAPVTSKIKAAMKKGTLNLSAPSSMPQTIADSEADIESLTQSNEALRQRADKLTNEFEKSAVLDEVAKNDARIQLAQQALDAALKAEKKNVSIFDHVEELKAMAAERGISDPSADMLLAMGEIRAMQGMNVIPNAEEMGAVIDKNVANAEALEQEAITQDMEEELDGFDPDAELPTRKVTGTSKKVTTDPNAADAEVDLTDENNLGEEVLGVTDENTEDLYSASDTTDVVDDEYTPGQNLLPNMPDALGSERTSGNAGDYERPNLPSLGRDLRSGRFVAREVMDLRRRMQTLKDFVTGGKKMTRKEALKLGAETVMDFVTMSKLAANQAKVLLMADRLKSPTIKKVYELLSGGVAGRTSDEAVSQGYHSAVSTETISYMNDLSRALKPLEERLKDLDRKGQMDLLEEIGRLVADGERTKDGKWIPKVPADPTMATVVKEIRALYKDLHAYQSRAGIDIKTFGGTYLPRMLNNQAVIDDRAGFIQAAKEAYKTTGMSEFEAERAAMLWYDAVLRGDSGFSFDQNFIFDAGNANGEPQHTRDRVFGPEADKIMDRFYNRNILDATNMYIARATRNAELSRRFGQDFGKYRQMQNDLINEGNQDALRELNELVQAQLGTASGGLESSTLKFLQAYSAIHFLPRATLSSLSEPAIIAVRTGNVMDALSAYYNTTVEMVKNVLKMDPSYHAELAEDLGLVLVALADSATSTSVDRRFFGDSVKQSSGWLTSQFFRKTGLAQFTDATRIASVKIGEVFLSRMAADVSVDSSSRLSSTRFLKELGVSDIPAFVKFVKDLKAMPQGPARRAAINDRKSVAAREYRQALIRFTEQTIMNPNAATRPKWASHPVGALFFNLQSYLYAFHENVTKRTVRMAGSALNPKSALTAHDRLRMASPIGILFATAGIQYALGLLREEILKDPAKKHKDRESGYDRVGRAISRANLIGRYDFLVNAWAGMKYQKDPATIMSGPVIGMISEAFAAAQKASSAKNSKKTNTNERQVARMAYDTLIQPVGNAAFAALPGWIGAPIGVAGIQATSHPATREAFVKKMAGSPVKPKKRPEEPHPLEPLLPDMVEGL